MTMNGRGRTYVTPSTETWFSCMHSSSADCVLGDARLTSSTRSRLVKTGPRRESNSLTRWSKTLTPVTSEGSRSGVNCRRENEQSSERARAFASIVFPTPGKSSMIRCPSATRHSTTRRNVSSGACTTRRRLAAIAPTRSAGAGATAGSAKEPLDFVEDPGGDLVLSGLRKRPLAARRHQRHPVVDGVEADVVARDVVEDDGVDVLARPLFPGSLETTLSLGGRKPDEHLPGTTCCPERLKDVSRRLELERPRRGGLGALRRERLGRPIVRDGRRD